MKQTEYQENLLFKLYDDRTYAIPLGLVSRLEEIQVNKIEKTGRQKIIRYLDAPMPLINLEKILVCDSASALDAHSQLGLETLSCVVVRVGGRHYGIVVKEVMDISIDNVDIDDGAVDREGVMGTLFINEQTVSLLDLYSILGSKQKKTPQPVLVNKKFQTGKILLVDDSPMYRKLEGDVLREAGYDVQTANNGVQGWEMFQTGSYDLVITDIEMPGMDGYGLARKVREQSNVPILALSTKASSADVEKGREFGFSHHLEKFEKDQVLALVSQILGEVNEGSHATIS
jgi:two-component system chemotaxis sensor kinase CheA